MFIWFRNAKHCALYNLANMANRYILLAKKGERILQRTLSRGCSAHEVIHFIARKHLFNYNLKNVQSQRKTLIFYKIIGFWEIPVLWNILS
jgi:hypothetical protein